MSFQLEICCTSLASAKKAQKAGATRVELCDNIFEGGTTPSAGLVASVKEHLDIPVFVLIRPRGGDFCYSEDDFRVMQLDVAACLSMGVDGIVSGTLKANKMIDQERTLTLLEMCRDVDFTFHRAFDLVPDQFDAMKTLDDLGVKRILTSGGKNNVGEGAKRIGKLIRHAGEELQIMAGGGLTTKNIDQLLTLGCREFHTTAKSWITTRKRAKVRMNGLKEIKENRYMEASEKEIVRLLKKIGNYSDE
jgi:copper homeostasis protein